MLVVMVSNKEIRDGVREQTSWEEACLDEATPVPDEKKARE